MSYRVEIVQPLEPNLNSYPSGETSAFTLARSHISNRVNIYQAGKLIATKSPGTDRLEHLKRSTE